MRFLRERDGTTELCFMPDGHAPEGLSNATHRLSDAVVVHRHPFQRTKYSGAGNCWCGRHAGSILHSVVTDPAAVEAFVTERRTEVDKEVA